MRALLGFLVVSLFLFPVQGSPEPVPEVRDGYGIIDLSGAPYPYGSPGWHANLQAWLDWYEAYHGVPMPEDLVEGTELNALFTGPEEQPRDDTELVPASAHGGTLYGECNMSQYENCHFTDVMGNWEPCQGWMTVGGALYRHVWGPTTMIELGDGWFKALTEHELGLPLGYRINQGVLVGSNCMTDYGNAITWLHSGVGVFEHPFLPV